MTQNAESPDLKIVIVAINSVDATSKQNARIQYLNRSASILLGYSTEELFNKPLETIFTPDYATDFWLSTINRRLNTDSDFSCQCKIVSSFGLIIPGRVTLFPLPGNKPLSTQIAFFIETEFTTKPAEETLSMMHIAVEQSASAVIITDSHGNIEYVNPKFSEMSGYTSTELTGKNPNIFQSGNTSPEQYQAMWQLLLETGSWQGEIKNKKKNGDDYWAYESISTIKNNDGEITHLLAIEEDITQRKQAVLALKESEERFRQMAALTGEWLWEQDPGGYYIYSSSAVKDILGYTPEESLGRHYSEFLTGNGKTNLQLDATLQKPFYSLINHYLHHDGRHILTESTGIPIRDSNGILIKWRGVDRDITAKKQAQDALADSEKRYRLIVESALNSIVIMDSYGMITDWNQQAEKMFGWKRSEVIGMRLDEIIIPPQFRKAHRLGLSQFLRSGKGPILNKLIEHTAIRRDNSEFPVELSISPLKIGNSYIFSGFIHDITQRKKTEEKIRLAQVELAIAQNEIKIARQIQSSLLPSGAIHTDQIRVTGYCLTADQVGGDYFDYFFRNKNRLDLVIADVSGHSVGPALFMVETRSALRTLANWTATPAESLQALNRLLFEDLNKSDYFITMFYLQYHTDTDLLYYANAGHPQALLLHSDAKQCIQLDAEGLILGIRQEVEFEEKSIQLGYGDILLLYTDGIIEAENDQGEFFGQERICNFFNESGHLDPDTIIEHLLEQLTLFCGKKSFNDDITLMILKRAQ